MGKPLKEAFDRPKPKISWNLSRGKERRGPQTSVRPVRLSRPCELWPRASQVVMAAENVMIATAATAPTLAKNLRTRALATIKLSPATTRLAIMAASAVLVCVRTSMHTPTTTAISVVRPRM